jgi:glutathione synthase/RimK-type ligase-like ATP-grasp enzyme
MTKQYYEGSNYMATSVGKWTKYKLMKPIKELSSHLPKTQLFSEKSLWEFTDKYNEVVFKPCMGDHGRGVILITSLPSVQYELHEHDKKIVLTGRASTFDYLKERLQSGRRPHILQQRIHMAEINNRAFDLRVIVQRNKNSSLWEVTGIIARIVAEKFFITNFVRELMSLDEAFTRFQLKKSTTNEMLNEINSIALLTATHLGKYYMKHSTISVDMALDKEENLWIIEVNLDPSIKPFKMLQDKSMYKRIKEKL